MWVQFEGPGNLSARRWHRVKQATIGRVTLCGRYVHRAPVTDARGDGLECRRCIAMDKVQRAGEERNRGAALS